MPSRRTATAIVGNNDSYKRSVTGLRERKKEPKANGAFPKDPPAYFSDAQRAMWDEIVRTVAPGVLTSTDVFSVEMVAVFMTEFREDPKGMSGTRLGRLSNEMDKLGLSPSARASLKVDDEPDAFGQLAPEKPEKPKQPAKAA